VGHWKCRTFIKRERKNGERCIYFVCDFNERWLKDLSFLCCIGILLKVEGRIVGNIKVGCFFEVIFLHFF
jgi:hypothetical protein